MSTEYIRQWRKDNPGFKDRQVRAARARQNALRELAELYPREFRRLLNKHRAAENLPATRG